MGQVYRYDPKSGRCNYQEPSKPQLKALQILEALGGTVIRARPGNRSAYSGCITQGWIKSKQMKNNRYRLTLTAAGRAELKHQCDRAAFAKAVGLPNTPQLAKLMFMDGQSKDESGDD